MTTQQNEPKIIIEETPDQATQTAASLFKGIVCEAVADQKTCCLALSGGTTPHRLYEQLAQSALSEEIPWGQVEVFFGDERCVPQDHPESNYRMAQRALLDHVPIKLNQVHPMPADSQDIDAAAGDYERLIRKIVPAEQAGIPRFDLILLGMGADGHIASLFPDSQSLDEDRKLVVSHYVPVMDRRRMTFTFPLINSARNVLILITGSDKVEVVRDVLKHDEAKRRLLPAARVCPTNGVLIYVLDRAAGRLVG